MNKAYLGIDAGTSSVKALIFRENGETESVKEAYSDPTPEGFLTAVKGALKKLDMSCVSAVGLTSQVGTYIIDEKDVLSWNSGVGKRQLEEIRRKYSKDEFIEEISMPHPDILSYPIPRLLYIREEYGLNVRVCQPKDLIGRMLTGVYATDVFSWRGLTNIEKGAYSRRFVDEIGIKGLPEVRRPFEKLGRVAQKAAEETGLKAGTPVYIGMNDFFASLAGMGLSDHGTLFDITGTSEHVGVITKKPVYETKLVSGPYLTDYVHYGVTASSGVSLAWADRMFGNFMNLPENSDLAGAPVFLPYLDGERAPVFDADARGVFFGISADTDKRLMAYSVMEGVVFSLYHIYETLEKPGCGRMIVSGGASDRESLNCLKAEMFGLNLITLKEKETSALGAVMAAAVGEGDYPDIRTAKEVFTREDRAYFPKGRIRQNLLKRYEIYKKLYPSLAESFRGLKEVRL